MTIEKWIIAHFSPTGGTKRIADAIAAGFETSVEEMDLTTTHAAPLGENDGLVAVLPVYGGRVPQIALERLSCLNAHGHKAVAVVVYGNREYEDALLETKEMLEGNGFRVIAAAAFIAEHSVVRSIAAGRPDEADKALCRKFAEAVMAKPDDAPSVEVPGNHPYKEIKPSEIHPAANDDCVRCGLCAAGCPVGAIPAGAPGTTRNDLCINCMRCVAVCPRKCRSMPAPFMAVVTNMLNEHAAGYKAPAVFL